MQRIVKLYYDISLMQNCIVYLFKQDPKEAMWLRDLNTLFFLILEGEIIEFKIKLGNEYNSNCSWINSRKQFTTMLKSLDSLGIIRI